MKMKILDGDECQEHSHPSAQFTSLGVGDSASYQPQKWIRQCHLLIWKVGICLFPVKCGPIILFPLAGFAVQHAEKLSKIDSICTIMWYSMIILVVCVCVCIFLVSRHASWIPEAEYAKWLTMEKGWIMPNECVNFFTLFRHAIERQWLHNITAMPRKGMMNWQAKQTPLLHCLPHYFRPSFAF